MEEAILDRHAWGDKDTWALGAVALSTEGGGYRHAGVSGSTVGWLTMGSDMSSSSKPAALWGHVQFAAKGDGVGSDELLYLNWQPHYAAGYINLQPTRQGEEPGHGAACCVMWRDKPEALMRRSRITQQSSLPPIRRPYLQRLRTRGPRLTRYGPNRFRSRIGGGRCAIGDAPSILR